MSVTATRAAMIISAIDNSGRSLGALRHTSAAQIASNAAMTPAKIKTQPRILLNIYGAYDAAPSSQSKGLPSARRDRPGRANSSAIRS